MAIVQKIKNISENQYERAYRYYAILSIINDLQLTKKELEVIAFTSREGNISDYKIKNKFYDEFGGSSFSLTNTIASLKKKKLLLKEKTLIFINPIISLDFKEELNIVITI